MACCQSLENQFQRLLTNSSLSKSYLVVTNALFACFGLILIVFGLLGSQHQVHTLVLFPVNVSKMINILGIIITFMSVVGLVEAFYRQRQAIHILYTTITLIALVYQLCAAVIVYNQAVHTTSWLSQIWAEASLEYRQYAQSKFSCCGFTHALDHPVPSSSCQPADVVNSGPPCYQPLAQFVRHNLQLACIVLFAALSIELLALCNAIHLVCTGQIIHDSPDEEHRSSLRTCFRLFSKPSQIQPQSMALNPLQKHHRIMVDSVISVKDVQPEPFQRQY